MLSVTAVAILVAVLLVIALAISELVAVVHEQTNTEPSWKIRVYSCRTRIVDAVPLTAIKIILVAWQIMTQVPRHATHRAPSMAAISVE